MWGRYSRTRGISAFEAAVGPYLEMGLCNGKSIILNWNCLRCGVGPSGVVKLLLALGFLVMCVFYSLLGASLPLPNPPSLILKYNSLFASLIVLYIIRMILRGLFGAERSSWRGKSRGGWAIGRRKPSRLHFGADFGCKLVFFTGIWQSLEMASQGSGGALRGHFPAGLTYIVTCVGRIMHTLAILPRDVYPHINCQWASFSQGNPYVNRETRRDLGGPAEARAEIPKGLRWWLR